MIKNNFLLIEIIVEELPSIYVCKLQNNFSKIKKKKLNSSLFIYSNIEFYVSLRRISFIISNVKYKNELYLLNIDEEKSFTDICTFVKNFLLFFLTKLVKDFVLFKWGDFNFKFLRPMKNIIILFNDKLIDLNIFNLISTDISYGNKFIGCPRVIINHVQNYVSYLYDYGKIILSFNDRKNKIIRFLKVLSLRKKYIFRYSDLFLNMISSMVEYPVFIISKFSSKFLFIPRKLLLYVIEDLYKCFPIFDNKCNLTNYFLIVSEVNEHVFLDVKFNYRRNIEYKLFNINNLYLNDRKISLFSYLLKLKNIVFYDNLGTLYDKVRRLKILSMKVFKLLNKEYDFNILNRSISLIKCDLVTSLCKEYMNFKGIIGMYYALLDKELLDISLIIKEHYYPRNFNDIMPSSFYGKVISLCDKLDTVVGLLLGNFYLYDKNHIFEYKLKNSNDLYGIKKLSSIILKIILFNKFDLNLFFLVKFSVFLFKIMFKKNKYKFDYFNYIFNFFYKRLFNYFIRLGYEKNIVNSFMNLNIFNILDINNRIIFINKIKNSNKFFSLLNISKRIKNILYKKSKFILLKDNFNILYLKKKEEIILYNYLFILNKKIKQYYLDLNCGELINFMLLSLNKVENFFDNVKINSNNDLLRNNRLCLLSYLDKLFLKFIDFSVFYK